MPRSFGITLSKSLPLDELRVFLERVVGSSLFVGRGLDEIPEGTVEVWVSVYETADPNWSCNLEFNTFPDSSQFGRCPNIALAKTLCEAFGADALLDPHDIVPELDPYDPYWSLGHIGCRWYLVSTAETALMGPYTDGVRPFPGDAKVRLVREVEIPPDCLPA